MLWLLQLRPVFFSLHRLFTSNVTGTLFAGIIGVHPRLAVSGLATTGVASPSLARDRPLNPTLLYEKILANLQ
jgi:hypothetical protein